MRKIVLVNKRTGKTMTLTYDEFMSKFKKEFESATRNFLKFENQKKPFYPFSSHSDFLLSFQWNFNTYSGSEWAIRCIR